MKGLLLFIGSFFLVSCAALPEIRPSADPLLSCPSPFLAAKTRLIHGIEVRLSGETRAVMIGVTLADPGLQTLSCALLTPEGMAVFEASRGPSGTVVTRALPPFDAADFARNMMNDIGLIFFAPGGALTRKGVLSPGDPVCRWHEEQGGWIDVSENRDGRIIIRRYAEEGALKRSVMLDAKAAQPYSHIKLQSSDMVNYTLIMTLIESEEIKNDLRLKE
jgi:hypothetical protein